MRVAKKSWPITKTQLKAGRTMADLGIRELARNARISSTAINLIETGKTRTPREQTLVALKSALQAHGVEFDDGGWVRLADDADNGNPSNKGNGRDGGEVERALLVALRMVRSEPQSDEQMDGPESKPAR